MNQNSEAMDQDNSDSLPGKEVSNDDQSFQPLPEDPDITDLTAATAVSLGSMSDLVQSNCDSTPRSCESLHSTSSIVQDNLSNSEISQHSIDFSTRCEDTELSEISQQITTSHGTNDVIVDVHSLSVSQYPLSEAASALDSVLQCTSTATPTTDATTSVISDDTASSCIVTSANNEATCRSLAEELTGVDSVVDDGKHQVRFQNVAESDGDISEFNHSIKLQPYMDRISIGDSLLDSRPISSSTPYHALMADDSGAVSGESGASFLPTEKTESPGDTEFVDATTEKQFELSDVDNPKHLIRSAGVDNYMSEGERRNLLSVLLKQEVERTPDVEVRSDHCSEDDAVPVDGAGIVLVGSNSQHLDLQTHAEETGMNILAPEEPGGYKSSLRMEAAEHPGGPAVQAPPHREQPVQHADVASASSGSVEHINDVLSDQSFHQDSARGALIVPPPRDANVESQGTTTASSLSVQSLGTDMSSLTEPEKLSAATSSSLYNSDGNISGARGSVLDGLGYSTDSLHSVMSHQSLYSQEGIKSAEDLRQQPLLRRVQQMGIMVLPKVTPDQLDRSKNRLSSNENDASRGTPEVLARVTRDSLPSFRSEGDLYTGQSRGSYLAQFDALSGSDLYEASGSVSSTSMSTSGSVRMGSISSSLAPSSLSADDSSHTSATEVTDSTLTRPVTIGDDDPPARSSVSSSQSRPTVVSVGHNLVSTSQESLTQTHSTSEQRTSYVLTRQRSADENSSPPRASTQGSPGMSEKSENTGTSIWSMEQVHHPAAHHTAAQVTNLSSATLSATKSLPSLSEASQEPIRAFVPSHVTSQPELEQGSLTSLDRAEMALDAMLAEQRRSHKPSTQVSSSVDDLLRQSTRLSAHTRDFGVTRGGLGSSLPHPDMVMSLPLSSRDVASVDSGRGSAPVTMGDSLRSSMANTSTSTRTVHRDDRLDSSQGHLPHPGRGSHVQEVHHLSSLQSGAGLKLSAQNQSVSGSGAHSQDTGSGSTTTHSSKEIERWLRGKSPFKDVDDSLSTEEGGHSQDRSLIQDVGSSDHDTQHPTEDSTVIEHDASHINGRSSANMQTATHVRESQRMVEHNVREPQRMVEHNVREPQRMVEHHVREPQTITIDANAKTTNTRRYSTPSPSQSDRQPSVIGDEFEELCDMMRPINVAEAINRSANKASPPKSWMSEHQNASTTQADHSPSRSPTRSTENITTPITIPVHRDTHRDTPAYNTSARSVVAPPTAPLSSGLDVIVLDYPAPGTVQLNYPSVTHVDTPRSDITSSSAPTDYNDLPAPKYAANTVDQTIGGDSGPIGHSSSRASPHFNNSATSTDLDQSVEKILTKYAIPQANGAVNDNDVDNDADSQQISVTQLSCSTTDTIGARVKELLQHIDSKQGSQEELAVSLEADIRRLVCSDQSSTVSQSSSLHTSDLLGSNDFNSNPDDTIMQRVRQLLSEGSDTSFVADEARSLCSGKKKTKTVKSKSDSSEDRNVPKINLFGVDAMGTKRAGVSQGFAPLQQSSSRTSESSSVNYDGLQQDLDDIQHGLQALQNGDLQLPSANTTQLLTADPKLFRGPSSESGSDTVANVSRYTQDSARQYNWDYSADLLSNEDPGGRFVSTNEFKTDYRQSRTQDQAREHHQIRQLGSELGSMLIRDVVSPDLEVADHAEAGLSHRVEEIMRRESPPRQAYRYLEEASQNQRIAGTYTSTYEPAPYMEITPARRHGDGHLPDRHLTPLNAMTDIRETLAAQLDKVTRRNFDQSLERSPVKRDERSMEGYQNQHRQELHEAGTSGAGATTADYVRETLRQYELSKPQPGILSAKSTPQSSTQSIAVVNDVMSPAIMSPAVTPIHETLKQFNESKRHNLQQDAFKRRQAEIERQVQEITEQRRLADKKLQQQLAEQNQKKIQRKSDMEEKERNDSRLSGKQRMKELIDRQQTENAVPQSAVPQNALTQNTEQRNTASEGHPERSTVSPSSGRLSPALTSSRGLKPYRPIGGTDVYYVESNVDDAVSVTTVESTHTGSDDAQPPMFPSHVLGSRSHVTYTGGVYSGARTVGGSELVTVAPEPLRTIPEQSTDDKSSESRSDNKSTHHQPARVQTVPGDPGQPHITSAAMQSLDVSGNKENLVPGNKHSDYQMPSKVVGSPLGESLERPIESHQSTPSTDRHPTALEQQISALQGDIQQYKEARGVNRSSTLKDTGGALPSPGTREREPLSGVNGSTDKQRDLEAYLQQQDVMKDVDFNKDQSQYKDTSPQYKDTIPQYKDTSLQYKDTSLQYKDTSPQYKDTSPQYKDTSLADTSANKPMLYTNGFKPLKPEALNSEDLLLPMAPVTNHLHPDERYSQSQLSYSPSVRTHPVTSPEHRPEYTSPMRAAQSSEYTSPMRAAHSSEYTSPMRAAQSSTAIHTQTTSTLPNISESPKVRSSSESDLQAMWERFLHSSLSTMRSQDDLGRPLSQGQRSPLDVERLSRLLENPVPQLMKLMEDKGDVNGKVTEGRRRSIAWEVEWENDSRRADNTDTRIFPRDDHAMQKKEFDEAYERALEKSLMEQSETAAGKNDREVEMRKRELLHLQNVRAEKKRQQQQEKGERHGRMYGRQKDEQLPVYDGEDSVMSQGSQSSTSTINQHPLDTSSGSSLSDGSVPTRAAGKDQPGAKKFICVEETLDSIPEDTTLDSVTTDYTLTTSADDSESLIISRSKKDLPGDPKLLRLQQKIRKQKEKQKAEMIRGHRRKEKIQQLQALLRNKSTINNNTSTNYGFYRADQHVLDGDSDVSSSFSTMKTSSTPPSPYRGQSSTFQPLKSYGANVSTTTESITEMSTTNNESTMCESATCESATCESALSDTACNCNICISMNSLRPREPRQAAREPSRQATATSRAGGLRSNSRLTASNPVTEPRHMKLQEVDYSRTPRKDKSGGQRSPTRRSKSESRPNEAKRKSWGKSFTPPKRGKLSKSVGVNVPTPISVTPPTKRRVSKAVTMVSAAIQTDMSKTPSQGQVVTKMKNQKRKTRKGGDENDEVIGMNSTQVKGDQVNPSQVKDDRAIVSVPLTPTKPRSNVSAFTPEHRPHDMTRNMRGVERKQQMRKMQQQQGSSSWFVPASESRPWRRPLHERQAHALASEKWQPEVNDGRSQWGSTPRSQQFSDHYSGDRFTEEDRENRYNVNRMAHDMQKSENIYESAGEKQASLQTAFRRHMQSFVTNSRMRQKRIVLHSAERRVQELNNQHRALLYSSDNEIINAVKRATQAEKDSHPYSANLYKPERRVISRQEAKEMTLKKYQNLPEVQQKAVEKKRSEEYKTNRMRAALYKKKIQNHVLRKRSAWN